MRNSDSKVRIQWRRDKVLELLSQGNNQSEISKILQIHIATINRDALYLRKLAAEKIKEYVNVKLPEEYEKCLVGLNFILREAWTASQDTEDKREKIQALSLAKECYSMKLDLLTNADVVDAAIRFINNEKNNNNGRAPRYPVVTGQQE